MWRDSSVTAAQAAFVLEPTSVSHAVVLLYFRSAVVRLSFRFDVVLFSVIALLWCLVSWWARLSTGASREAPVDNECLGKCSQVSGSGESWHMSYWQLG